MRIEGLGFRIEGLAVRVQGSGFRVYLRVVCRELWNIDPYIVHSNIAYEQAVSSGHVPVIVGVKHPELRA